MKFGARWHVKGVRPEAQETAREAARRAGVPVGQWLDSLIIGTAAEEKFAAAAAAGYPGSARTGETADAMSRLDQRVNRLMNERRGGSGAPQRQPVDLAAGIGRERVRAGMGDLAGIDQAAAEIARRQAELDGGEASREAAAAQAYYSASIDSTSRRGAEPFDRPQLHVSVHEVVAALRKDIAEVTRALNEASPRRAIEALEGEVRALTARVDARRSTGADNPTLANLERDLAEVRDSLRTLTPAENLAGFGGAIDTLSRKVEQVAAGTHDPAALEQLEAAILGLRGIVSHVASADALGGLTAEVRTLAEKIERGLPHGGRSADLLDTLDQRIAVITDALQTAGLGALPNSAGLDATIRALGEKVERLDPVRGEALLRQLEQRIGNLVDKLEASELRVGNLDTIEHGIGALLDYLEELRDNQAVRTGSAPPRAGQGRDAEILERDVRRAQDSLEAVHGTIGDVVDRLAMIETGMRASAGGEFPVVGPLADPTPAPEPPAAAWPPAMDERDMPLPSAAQPDPVAPPHVQMPALRPAAEAGRPSPAQMRPDSDQSLSPHSPLEPGSGAPRSTAARVVMAPAEAAPPAASPAERIAASKAAFDPVANAETSTGPKSNFIIAARRAAQAAVEEQAAAHPRASVVGASQASAARGSRVGKHIKSVLVGLSVVVILAGVLHLAVSFLDTRDSVAEAPKPQSSAEPAADSAPPPNAIAEVAPSASALSGNALPMSAPAVTAPASQISQQTLMMPWGATANAATRPDAAAGANNGSMPAASTAPQMQRMPPPAPVAATPSPPLIAAMPPAVIAVPPAAAPAPGRPSSASGLPPAIGSKVLIAAAESGDPAAAYEIAVRFTEGRGVAASPEEAAVWFERAAKSGLALAQFRLGGAYEKGLGVPKNLQRARDLYVGAADKGHAKAMHNLAVLYAEGIDGKPDYSIGVQWFRKAAAYGVADSQYNLGVLYARGIGVEQNLAESFKWFALAAQQGDRDAAQKRDDVAKRLDLQTLNAARLAVQNWVAELQPDSATMVKTPAGGWDEPAAKPTPGKGKSKNRAQSSAGAVPI